MQLLDILFHALDELVDVGEPYKTLLISGIVTTLTCISVMLIGILSERIERVEYRLLRNMFTHKAVITILEYLTFPGVMLHECAHALFAWFTGAQINKVRLLVFFNAHKLGEVIYTPRGNKLQRSVQMSFTSCAPVIMGLIELSIIVYVLHTCVIALWLKILLIYLFICILNHMSMSELDVRGYLRGMLIVYPVLFLVFYAIRLYVYR